MAVPSSCQMYSGTGTAIFDWVAHCRSDFDFAFLMDSSVRVNFAVTAAFCERQEVPLYTSSPLFLAGCPDTGLSAIAQHLQQHTYDFVECVSWANASTNLSVMGAKARNTKLLFTPHSQPFSTLRDHGRYFMVGQVFSKMLHSADAVFIDSMAEKSHPCFAGVPDHKLHSIPLGVDVDKFKPEGMHESYELACVCDCREPRKRMDLLLAAFSAAHRIEPKLKLILAGMGSDALAVPEEIAQAVRRLGYIDSTDLLRLYQTTSAVVLISDYEAFGLPIAEALCCGSRVLLNQQPVLYELFGGLPGVYWTGNTDLSRTAQLMVQLASPDPDFEILSRAAQNKFAFKNTYSKKRDIVLALG
jgi:glycosyltransferase involved in cell wall biosynthesis